KRSAAPVQGADEGFSIWTGVSSAFRERVLAIRQGQGSHRDERSLLDGEPIRTQHADAGTNETCRVQFDNGIIGYFKPFDGLNDRLASEFGHREAEQPLHEAAAWQLARQMGPPYAGMVPPVVIRQINGRLGSLSLERAGAPMCHKPWHVPEWTSAAFFDALVGQQDRHPDNFLVAG